jgi:hypothetical protein
MTEVNQTAVLRRELADEAQRIFINAEYTGRQHMYAGQDWRTRATKIGLPVAILTAAVGSGAAGVAALFGWDPRITVVFGFAGAIAGAVRLFFKADDQAAAHSTKGARYIAIAGEARRFRKIDLNSDAEIAGLVKELRDLAGRLDALREVEPRELPKGLYQKVKADIEKGNYNFENDPLWERDKEGEQHGDDGAEGI